MKTSSNAQNKKRAEQYLKEKQGNKNVKTGNKGVVSKVGTEVNKALNTRRDKARERQESYDKTQKYFGKGGVAIRSANEYARKKIAKATMANIINEAANSYISANGAKNYKVSRGVDFARRSSIYTLSLSFAADSIRMYSDIARAYMKG